MRRSQPTRESFEILSWASEWDADRIDDRRGLKLALALAVVIHAALLVVRIADETVALPAIDAVIRPQLKTLVVKRPEPSPPPEIVRRAPQPSALRVSVPAELAPPEPLPIREIPTALIELAPAPVSLLALPAPPPMASQDPVRFTGEMDRPVRVAGVDPAYTEIARKVREQGVVILDAVIDRVGEVTEIEVVKPLGFGLTESALRAVETWRFEPARLDGRPISVRYTLTVRFSLR